MTTISDQVRLAPACIGLGLLIFIDAHAQPPNEAERALVKHGYMRVKSAVRGAVQVVEGQGFVAAAMRGALMIANVTATLGYPCAWPQASRRVCRIWRRGWDRPWSARPTKSAPA